MRWPDDQSKTATIFGYVFSVGCIVAILAAGAGIVGYLVYSFVTETHKMLSFLAFLGVVYAVLIACAAAWYGLLWAVRSENKRTKESLLAS